MTSFVMAIYAKKLPRGCLKKVKTNNWHDTNLEAYHLFLLKEF